MKNNDWDGREKRKEEYDAHLKQAIKMTKIYFPLVEKYVKLNDIEMPPEDDDDHLVEVYNFVWDPKFIDFAYDESGIVFNAEMFELGFTDEELEEFKGKKEDMK